MTTEKYTYTSITLIKSHQIELYFNIPVELLCSTEGKNSIHVGTLSFYDI